MAPQKEKLRDSFEASKLVSFCSMNKKVYVGNLSWDTTEDGLKDFFSQAGTVESAVIIKNKMTGKSKGFGFVTFENEDSVGKAIKANPGPLATTSDIDTFVTDASAPSTAKTTKPAKNSVAELESAQNVACHGRSSLSRM